MGPHMLFHLAAGPGGMGEFCNRYRDSFHRWWDDLDEVELSESLAEELAAGVQQEAGDNDVAELAKQRDAMIVAMLKGTAPHRS